MNYIDYLYVLLLAIVLPVAWTLEYRHWVARIEKGEAANRAGSYRRTVLQQWGIAIILGITWWWMQRSPSELGFIPPSGAGFWISVGLTIVAVLLLILSVRSIDQLDADSARQQCKKFGDLYHFFPHNSQDYRYFVALSFTSGMVEELVYRGYLMWVFGHFLPIWGAVLASSVIFGLAHSYQGLVGIVRTGLLGILLAGLFILSGSLWVPMVAHALLDMVQGLILLKISRKADSRVDVRNAESDTA